jgi:hypothetical protein
MRKTLFTLSLLIACNGADDSARAPDAGGDGVSGVDTDDSGIDGPTALASCAYTNPFSQDTECKEYIGADWDLAKADADCAMPVPGSEPGVLSEGESCGRDDVLGECIVGEGESSETRLVFPGTDAGGCSGAELGCGFAGGEFVPSEVCTDTSGGGGGGGTDESVFKPFEQVCLEPLEGEPVGEGPDGQVCTWEAISGATEEGRRFVDYASCEPVLSQRPYWAYEVESAAIPDDARLDDAEWVEEFEWVTGQVESSACVCCHSADLAPEGPSGWYLEADGVWIDTVDDDGLAMLAGWVDSTAFGAFDAEDNNGFDRTLTGQPSTDPERMRDFLVGELTRRGLVEADFAETQPFGGPLYDQLFYEPEACEGGEGVDASGEVRWAGGGARYVYVLEADAMSPGVPPNLDTPEGTLWRLDVSHLEPAVESGIAFGSVPQGAGQVVPAEAAAPVLQSGEQYYLVALRDIYQPLTRCLFTAP